jgi:Tol biopolymer transport system component
MQMKAIRALLGLFAFAILLITTACGQSAARPSATLPAHSDTLVFSKPFTDDGQGNDIYTIQTDGSGLTKLAHEPGTYMESPAWSPDGTRIAYDSGTETLSSYNVWSMNADGSGKVQLTKLPIIGVLPSWSQDGQQITFSGMSEVPGWFHLYIMNANGSDIRAVTNAESDDLFPTWAPDGRILFIRLPRHVILGDVFAMNPDGSGLVQLTKKGTLRGFALSPDGKSLAVYDYVLRRIVKIPTTPPRDELTLMDSFFDCDDTTLTWSPDGKVVALACRPWDSLAVPSALYIVNADGSGFNKVDNAGLLYDPDWKP